MYQNTYFLTGFFFSKKGESLSPKGSYKTPKTDLSIMMK